MYPARDSSELLLEADLDLEGEDSYTLAAVGQAEDDSLAARLYEDDDSPPTGDNARLRAIHAVSDVGPATVGARGGGDLFALPGFSNASTYVEVPAGDYALQVRPTGTGQAVSLPGVTLSAGEIYTAFVVGRAADGTLDAILTADSANGSQPPLETSSGVGAPRAKEEPVAALGGPQSREVSEPEAGEARAAVLEPEVAVEPETAVELAPSTASAPVEEPVIGFSEPFDQTIPADLEPGLQQSTAQYGAVEEQPATDTAPTSTTTTTTIPTITAVGESRSTGSTRTEEAEDVQTEDRNVGDENARPARAEITATGVTASAGGATATVGR